MARSCDRRNPRRKSLYSEEVSRFARPLRVADLLQVAPEKPGKHAQVELAAQTPPLAQGVEQPVPWICSTCTPLLPPARFATSATPSHATTRRPEEPPTCRIAHTPSEMRNESTTAELELREADPFKAVWLGVPAKSGAE